MSEDLTREEVLGSFRIVMRSIADLELRVETCRAILRRLGITDSDFESVQAAKRRAWDAQTEPALQRLRDRRELETLLDEIEK